MNCVSLSRSALMTNPKALRPAHLTSLLPDRKDTEQVISEVWNPWCLVLLS